MKKLLTICIASLLTLSLVACSSNKNDKEESKKDEPKTEENTNTTAKAELKSIQDKIDTYSTITATVTNQHPEINETGTITFTIGKEFDDFVEQLDVTGNEQVPHSVEVKMTNGEIEMPPIGGRYPFLNFRKKFKDYLNVMNDTIIKIEKNGDNKIYKFTPGKNATTYLEVNKNNDIIKLTRNFVNTNNGANDDVVMILSVI